jgi:hypothetical protein
MNETAEKTERRSPRLATPAGDTPKPGSYWIVRRNWVEIKVAIVGRLSNGRGWTAFALDSTNDLICVRKAQLVRPATP